MLQNLIKLATLPSLPLSTTPNLGSPTPITPAVLLVCWNVPIEKVALWYPARRYLLFLLEWFGLSTKVLRYVPESSLNVELWTLESVQLK